jgi:hypothetical protein
MACPRHELARRCYTAFQRPDTTQRGLKDQATPSLQFRRSSRPGYSRFIVRQARPVSHSSEVSIATALTGRRQEACMPTSQIMDDVAAPVSPASERFLDQSRVYHALPQ